MILFPHAKINLGLNILHKREDGYHEIETALYPVGLCDVMELITPEDARSGRFELTVSGDFKDLPEKDNILARAYRLLGEERPLPALQLHLHKLIPPGAGLGGGSSDAAFFLRVLNEWLAPKLPDNELRQVAGQLGADCPFFLQSRPALATGKGEKLRALDLSLQGWYLLIFWPGFGIPTRAAYASCEPGAPSWDIPEILQTSPDHWRERLSNQFENSLFRRYPELKQLKDGLYRLGAAYASMSGSGSAVFGLFRERPGLSRDLAAKLLWEGQL